MIAQLFCDVIFRDRDMGPGLSSISMDEIKALPTFNCQSKAIREQGRISLLWGEFFLGKGFFCTRVGGYQSTTHSRTW